MAEMIEIEILRYRPEQDNEPWMQTFQVPYLKEMSLLDALALCLALRRPLEDALPDYAAMRRWHVRIYQGMSAALTPMYQSGSRALPWLRDRLLAPASTLPLVRGGLTHLVAGTMIPPLAGAPGP